jgi:diamine N-acetyltransferase
MGRIRRFGSRSELQCLQQLVGVPPAGAQVLRLLGWAQSDQNGRMSDSPVTTDSAVSLRPISEENVVAIIKLDVAENQKDLVAPNSVSIAQAAHTANRWERAIYADNEPVGYVLLSENRTKPRYYLWRYMIDHRYQGMGFGRRAMEMVIDYVRTLPDATEMYLTYVPVQHGPREFYAGLGFVDTGVEHDGELEMRLEL